MGWRHDFWRAPGTDGRVMGWLELKAWLGVVRRQREPAQPDPDRWTPASEANFDELHKIRDKMRGRG